MILCNYLINLFIFNPNWVQFNILIKIKKFQNLLNDKESFVGALGTSMTSYAFLINLGRGK